MIKAGAHGRQVTITCDFAWDGKTHQAFHDVIKA